MNLESKWIDIAQEQCIRKHSLQVEEYFTRRRPQRNHVKWSNLSIEGERTTINFS